MKSPVQSVGLRRPRSPWKGLIVLAATISVFGAGAYVGMTYERRFGARDGSSVLVDVNELQDTFDAARVESNGVVAFTKQDVERLFARLKGHESSSDFSGSHFEERPMPSTRLIDRTDRKSN